MSTSKVQSQKSPGPDKLKHIIFKYLPQNTLDIISFIYKACLKLHYTPKYLGVTLDRRLNWRDHVNDKISTCKAMLLNITNKYRHTHRAKPILMKWIYTGVIRPKSTYACLI